MPAWFYDWKNAVAYDEAVHGAIRARIRDELAARATTA